MKNTIPQSTLWIYLVVILLPFNGGFINAATVVGFLHHAVGYVTGNVTNLGTGLIQGNIDMVLQMLGIFLAFLCGALLSGLLIKSEHFRRDLRYGTSLLLQAILVGIAIILLSYRYIAGEYVLAMVMGLQNALTTHYGSAIIRTTHMTGTTTDLGIQLGLWLKGDHQHAWKIKLYSLLILFFLIGAIAGGIIFTYLGQNALWISIIIYVIMIATHQR